MKCEIASEIEYFDKINSSSIGLEIYVAVGWMIREMEKFGV